MTDEISTTGADALLKLCGRQDPAAQTDRVAQMLGSAEADEAAAAFWVQYEAQPASRTRNDEMALATRNSVLLRTAMDLVKQQKKEQALFLVDLTTPMTEVPRQIARLMLPMTNAGLVGPSLKWLRDYVEAHAGDDHRLAEALHRDTRRSGPTGGLQVLESRWGIGMEDLKTAMAKIGPEPAHVPVDDKVARWAYDHSRAHTGDFDSFMRQVNLGNNRVTFYKDVFAASGMLRRVRSFDSKGLEAELAWGQQVFRDLPKILKPLPDSRIDDALRAGQSVVANVSHASFMTVTEVVLRLLGHTFAKIGANAVENPRAGNLNVNTSDSSTAAYTRLIKQAKAEPMCIAAAPDGRRGSGLEMVNVLGVEVPVGLGAAKLALLAKAKNFFLFTRWDGAEVAFDVEEGPDGATARSKEAYIAEYLEFYRDCLERSLTTAPVDLYLTAGVWQAVRHSVHGSDPHPEARVEELRARREGGGGSGDGRGEARAARMGQRLEEMRTRLKAQFPEASDDEIAQRMDHISARQQATRAGTQPSNPEPPLAPPLDERLDDMATLTPEERQAARERARAEGVDNPRLARMQQRAEEMRARMKEQNPNASEAEIEERLQRMQARQKERLEQMASMAPEERSAAIEAARGGGAGGADPRAARIEQRRADMMERLKSQFPEASDEELNERLAQFENRATERREQAQGMSPEERRAAREAAAADRPRVARLEERADEMRDRLKQQFPDATEAEIDQRLERLEARQKTQLESLSGMSTEERQAAREAGPAAAATRTDRLGARADEMRERLRQQFPEDSDAQIEARMAEIEARLEQRQQTLTEMAPAERQAARSARQEAGQQPREARTEARVEAMRTRLREQFPEASDAEIDQRMERIQARQADPQAAQAARAGAEGGDPRAARMEARMAEYRERLKTQFPDASDAEIEERLNQARARQESRQQELAAMSPEEREAAMRARQTRRG